MMSSEEAPLKGAAAESPSVTETESAAPTEPETAPAASAPTESVPAAAETPATASDETSSTGDEETPRRRVRLNPTLGQESAKPVGLFEATTAAPKPIAAPPAETSAPSSETPTPEAPAGASAPVETSPPAPEAKPAPTPPPRFTPAPVEIPRADDSLDAEMEAEIAAAMESGELKISAEVPTPKVESETGDEEPATEDSLEKGTKLTGKIQSVHGDDVFLDVGFRSPGVVPMRQFTSGKKPEVGQMIEVVVERFNAEEGLILLNLPRGVRKSAGDWESIAAGQVIDCMVTATNKGGLEVAISNLRGFMPASQVDVGFVPDLNVYVGQKLRVEITEVNPKKRRLIVSRRNIAQAERQEKEAEAWTKLTAGQTHRGTVKTIKDYGAFVDIGGVDGFLHIGEISHNRIRHPSDILKEGAEVEVQILKLDPESRKISLGMKQLIADPWQSATSNYPAESTVTGKVTRVADFGAFVELEAGVEGLVHISEIDHKRVGRVADVLRVGQEVQAQVQEVDPDRKRISLSLKALKQKPEDPRAAKREEDKPVEPYQRQRTGPLKGGNSSTAAKPGGLFGNPDDFR